MIRDFFYGGGFIKNKKLDHLCTLCMHTICCVLIYLAFGSNLVSFMAALLYSVNPSNAQTSIWLNGRRYLTTVIIALLVWWLKPISLFLCVFIPYLQFGGVAIPLLYAITPHWWMLIVASPLILLYRKRLQVWLEGRTNCHSILKLKQNEIVQLKPQKVIVMVKTLGYYFWRGVFPTGIYFYAKFLQNFGVDIHGTKNAYELNWDFYKGIVTLSICSLLAIYVPCTRLGLFWWFLFIIMWSNFITLTMTVADRYMCIANVGLMLVVANLINIIGYTYGLIAFTVLCTLYLTILHKEKGMYSNIDDFYKHHTFNYPDIVIANLHHSKAAMGEIHDLYGAYVYTRRCLRYNPKDIRLNFRMAKILRDMNYKKDAREFADLAKTFELDQTFATKEKMASDFEILYESLKEGK